jgi:uncharacterized membrane protein (UPF0127 family)
MKKANPHWAALLLVGLAGATGGCGGRESAAAAAAAAPPSATPAVRGTQTVADYFALSVGGRKVRVQLAVTPPEMERGLMERTQLGPDDGMLFVYAQPQSMSFWMHDTPTALDLGYFGPDGVLAEVYPLYPFDERAVSSRSKRLQFALEMNQGWFSAHGVRAGAALDLAAVRAALAARGFAPERYGLR